MLNLFKKNNIYTIEINNYHADDKISDDILNTDDINVIKKEINNIINNISKEIETTNNYFNSHYNRFKEMDSKTFKNYYKQTIQHINKTKNIIDIEDDKNKLITILKDLKYRLADVKEEREDLLEKEIVKPIETNKPVYINSKSVNTANNYNYVSNNNEEDEIKKRNPDLDPWQIDLIKKGEYNEDDFEEEELDEDNYYYDDEEE